ncbi:MAG: lipoprotein signal peptidase [Holophagaceae bacterium]|nr:lipoprotein signal peptidase [Holophagaceae bacterium]
MKPAWTARLPWLLLPLVALGLDAWSKLAILARFQPGEVRAVIPGCFNLTLGFNPGAVFGSFANASDGLRTTLFLVVGLLAVLYFGYEFLKASTPTLMRLSYGLILGGALGNSLDRVVRGSVVDFLDFYYGNWHYWTFNIADCCIVVGAVLLGIALLQQSRRS